MLRQQRTRCLEAGSLLYVHGHLDLSKSHFGVHVVEDYQLVASPITPIQCRVG